MKKKFTGIWLGYVAICWSATTMGKEIVIYDATTPVSSIVSRDHAKLQQTSEGLWIETYGQQTQGKEVYPGIAVKGEWNLDDFNAVEVVVLHRDEKGALPLRVRLDGPTGGLKGEKDTYVISTEVSGKGTTTCMVRILPAKFQTTGMRRAPWDGDGLVSSLEGKRIVSVSVYMPKPLLDWKWGLQKMTLKKIDWTFSQEREIKPFRLPTEADYRSYFDANPVWETMTKEEFFPFIDVYGQFKYKDWPGKIHNDADLHKAKELEARDLAAHPGPKGWNRYGGWADGPRYKATGHFRVEKIKGKWWMIDPEGCLYWSNGPVRVTSSSAVTPLDGREDYFTDLPDENSELGAFYQTRDELLWPYYEKRNIRRTYDFSSANAYRKYGRDWRKIYGELAHQRLRSWGMNTIANSSDVRICLMEKTPFTDRIELKSPAIAASTDGWWPFRDPFHPEFRADFRRQLLEREKELNSPWCIGFFVDNELNWGNDTSLGEWTLQSPKEQCAKVEFVRRLQQKYQTIEKLNAAWGSDYASWEGLLETKKEPPEGAKVDCGEFSDVVVEAYYRIIREEFKKVAPHTLYLGCRFAGHANEKFLRIGAKYCDALSFNIYRFTLDDFHLPKGLDLPILVGEWHFGALDRGMFHWTLIGVKNQEERAAACYRYVESALKHPNFIGVHWHQYGEQATTGRFDGENFQNGFLDVCDTPYWETIGRMREIGYQLYPIRWGK